MSGMREIAEIRRRLVGMCRTQDEGTFPAIVREVDGKCRTCVVEYEGITYDDVLLYAVEDSSQKGCCLIPAVGSIVLVSRIGGSNELYVAMFSKVQEVRLMVGDSSFGMTEEGFTVTRGNSGLRRTLEKLIDTLCTLTVTTGVGPSGTPVNVADFKEIKEDLKNYLKG